MAEGITPAGSAVILTAPVSFPEQVPWNSASVDTHGSPQRV